MSDNSAQHIVLGMAGHIDHGKTAIVKALTGTDTDRLKEEKERGMTTDLGFAFLGNDITIIDVPGHEKFVKTMVAGVNTIDVGLLVIAADDGVMPQTEEHLEILDLLQVPSGLVVINKIDLVDEEWLKLVIDDVKAVIKGTVLEDTPIVSVSAVNNTGIDKLKDTIVNVAKEVKTRKDKGIFRLPVDRVFTIKGFGTVVAGTVLSGKVLQGDTVELLPQCRQLRVRGIQVHDKPVKEVSIGFRTALNLGKIEKEAIERGDVLAEPGYYKPTFMIDAYFSLLKSWTKEMKNRTRVRVHIGTSEVIARIVLLDKEIYSPGDSGFVQLHFEKPVVPDRNDRFVIRSYSPLRTLGGGVILDTHPRKHRRFKDEVLNRLKRLLKGNPNQVVIEHLDRQRFIPKTVDDLMKMIALTKDDLLKRLQALEDEKDVLKIGKKRFMSAVNYEILKQKVLNLVEDFHEREPLKYAISTGKLRQLIKQPVDKGIFDEILAFYRNDHTFIIESDNVKLKSHTAKLPQHLKELKSKIEKLFIKEPLNPPNIEDVEKKYGENAEKLLNFMIESGELVKVEKGVCFSKDGVNEARSKIFSFLSTKKKEASIGEMREILQGMSRRKAVALLEYFDRIHFTERVGDVRKLK